MSWKHLQMYWKHCKPPTIVWASFALMLELTKPMRFQLVRIRPRIIWQALLPAWTFKTLPKWIATHFSICKHPFFSDLPQQSKCIPVTTGLSWSWSLYCIATTLQKLSRIFWWRRLWIRLSNNGNISPRAILINNTDRSSYGRRSWRTLVAAVTHHAALQHFYNEYQKCISSPDDEQSIVTEGNTGVAYRIGPMEGSVWFSTGGQLMYGLLLGISLTRG